MPSITVRNIPDAVHRAIRVRAAQHGHSIEAEMRDILEQAARPTGRLKIGALIASITAETGGLSDAEYDILNNIRDQIPAEPLRFE